MGRRLTALVLVIALAGLVVTQAEAKGTKKKKSVAVTYHMNWMGDCAGTPYLALEATSNPDSCALFFPGLGDTYSFYGSEGVPFTLDASKPIVLDFVLGHVASAAADFEVVLEGEIKGDFTPIATGAQTVIAGTSAAATPLHYELEPEKSLDKAKVTAVNLTVSWTNGVTYSTIDFDAGSSLVIGTFK